MTGSIVSTSVLENTVALFRPKRSIGAFVAHVTIEENHSDDLEITDHPVDVGSAVSDHAFKLPTTVVIRCGWTNSASIRSATSSFLGNSQEQIRDVYEKVLKAQADRIPMDVFTGKRVLKNMLMKSIQESTTVATEESLVLTITLRQVLLASTQVITLAAASISPDKANLSDPGSTQVPAQKGTKQAIPATPYTGAR